MSNHYRAGALVTADALVTVTPEQAGWTYSGLEVFDLGTGPVARALDGIEGVLVPLSATDLQVTVDGDTHTLRGRKGVFEAITDWMYLPLGSEVEVRAATGEVALCTARASERFPLRVTAAEDVKVEVRGGGCASRQVTNIATPDSFPGADRINVCEVLTPGGNVSSWPPHRHDGIGDCGPTNEEIYYFRMGQLDAPHGHPHGQGLFRVYTVDGASDETVTVLDGDVHIVAAGYHGPSTAQPEYPMYFLNVLAGPGAERTMAFCDDPDHHWIRESWVELGQDPRLPMTSATGRVVR